MAIGSAADKSIGDFFRKALSTGEGKMLVGFQKGDIQLLKSVDRNGLKALLADGGTDITKKVHTAPKVHTGDHIVPSPKVHTGPKAPGKLPVPAVKAGEIMLTSKSAAILSKLGLSKVEARKLLAQADAVRQHALTGGKTEQQAFAEAEGFLKGQLPKATGDQLNALRESISPNAQSKMQRFLAAAKKWRKTHGQTEPKKPVNHKTPTKKPVNHKTPTKKPVEPKKPVNHQTPTKKPVEPTKPVVHKTPSKKAPTKKPVVTPSVPSLKNQSIFNFISGSVGAIKKTLDGMLAGLKKMLGI